MLSTRGRAVCADSNTCRPKRASTPASSAAAIAAGMRSITRSNQPLKPHSAISAALTIKAPTASAMLKPPATPAAASTAAPGVDQATITGLRSSSEGTAQHRPMPQPRAHIHELICAGVAPKAWAAWNTRATELVTPTNTATKPALSADRLKSLKNCMAHIVRTATAQRHPVLARRGRRHKKSADPGAAL